MVADLFEEVHGSLPGFPGAVDVPAASQWETEPTQAAGFSSPVTDISLVCHGFFVGRDGGVKATSVEVRLGKTIQDDL
jgi:hypothetical protein